MSITPWNSNSVIPVQPVGRAAPAYTDFTRKAYLSISRSGRNRLDKLVGADEARQLMPEAGFWEFIIVTYSETHTETADPHNVLADTYVAIATGFAPVHVQMNGLLWMTPTRDHRTDFIYFYDKVFRGTQLHKDSKNPLLLEFAIKDTSMSFYPLGITINQDAQVQDHVAFSLTGIGYNYRVGL